MNAPPRILAEYPAEVAAGPWTSVAGGFSGARLWRSESGWRLKSWPDISADQLRQIHAWMIVAGLDVVPAVARTRNGDTAVDTWDVVRWMPGEPLLRDPTPRRLASAGRALARLHLAWGSVTPVSQPCPAIHRRLDRLTSSPEASNASLGDLARRHIPAALASLLPWTSQTVATHPCLCDVWTDHVLFDANDLVTGFIDFGAARIDSPMTDLARLLGDCLPGRPFAWQPLLDAYHAILPLSPADHALLGVLEFAGAVAALVTWSERLARREPTAQERRRVEALVRRFAEPPAGR